MFYFFACIATPMAVNCTPPQIVESRQVCEFLGNVYRDTVIVLHRTAAVQRKCIEVPRGGQTLPESPDIPPPNVQLP